jgi:thiol-disulfide isomerase/thioredoxin
MALTPSHQIPLGTIAPDFELLDTISGTNLRFDDVKGSDGTVVMFICNHCPFVIHINKTIVHLAQKFQAQGINFVAISANDAVNFPQDSAEKMTHHAQQNDYCFPYLYDETQTVAKAYEATCTPDIFVFDGDKKLFYHGQIDAARPGNDTPVTGNDLSTALECLLQKKSAPTHQTQSIGCNIKWK